MVLLGFSNSSKRPHNTFFSPIHPRTVKQVRKILRGKTHTHTHRFLHLLVRSPQLFLISLSSCLCFILCVCVLVRRGLIMAVYLTVLLSLYLIPLGLYSPCIKEKWTLGPAPALIGHRGAPMVSKNTVHSPVH